MDEAHGFNVGADWELKSNGSDAQAMFANGGGKLKMFELLPKRQSPNAVSLFTGNCAAFNLRVHNSKQAFVAAATQASAAVQRHGATDDAEVFHQATRDKLKTSLLQERDDLQQRKDENKNKRNI